MIQLKFKNLMLTSVLMVCVESSHSVEATAPMRSPSAPMTAGAKIFEELYNNVHKIYAEMGGKEPKKENLMSAAYKEEINKLLQEIKALKCDKQPEKRDFHAEYEKLIVALSTVGDADKKEAERLNLAIGRLETEALKAGIHLGEGAEKQESEREAQKMDLESKKAREAARMAEIEKDATALKTKNDWLPTITGAQPQEDFPLEGGSKKLSLVDLLKMPDRDLYTIIMHIKMNPIAAKLITQEKDERVNRALRAWAQAQLDKKRATPLTYIGSEYLKTIIAAVDSRLGDKGGEGSTVSSQAGGFTASPEEKEAYQKFQYIWTEAQKNPSSKINQDITRIKSTDELTKFILMSEDELRKKTFDKNIKNRLQFSSATPLELKAFKYALSLAQTGSISAKELMELKQKIDSQLATTQHQIANLRSIKELAMNAKASDIKTRASEEDIIAAKQFGGTPPPPKKTGAPPLPPKGFGAPQQLPRDVQSHETDAPTKPAGNAFLEELLKKRKKID